MWILSHKYLYSKDLHLSIYHGDFSSSTLLWISKLKSENYKFNEKRNHIYLTITISLCKIVSGMWQVFNKHLLNKGEVNQWKAISTHLWALLLINLDSLKSSDFPLLKWKEFYSPYKISVRIWDNNKKASYHWKLFKFYYSVKSRMTTTSPQDSYHSTYFLQPSCGFFFKKVIEIFSSILYHPLPPEYQPHSLHFCGFISFYIVISLGSQKGF